MKLLDDFFAVRDQIHKYFGYKEDWVTIPLDDQRTVKWSLAQNQDGSGKVYYWDADKPFDTEGNWYSAYIYTQRFLPKWVYRGAEYTMISIDTKTDGNKFLAIFDNAKEVPYAEIAPQVDAFYRAWEKRAVTAGLPRGSF